MPQNSLENACARVSFLINSLFSILLKKRLWRRWFPVNFAKFIRTSFLQNTFGGCLWSLQSLLIFRGRKRCYRRNVGTLEKTILKTILSNYETCNIFSVDEFDLFNQALPQKTLNLKKMWACCCEHEQREAFHVCHRQIKNTTLLQGINKLPCRWRGQKKSWINSEFLKERFKELDGEFEKEQH